MEKNKLDLINGFFRKDKSVLASYLFGSQATGKANKFSDIDIAVLFDSSVDSKDYTDKQLTLMSRLSLRIDREVDVVVLNHASAFLKYQVLKEGARVYERPGRDHRSFEAQAVLEYFDYLPVRDRIQSAILKRVKRYKGLGAAKE